MNASRVPQNQSPSQDRPATKTVRGGGAKHPILPGKGWCFHRGAKLVRSQEYDHEAVWFCPSCQNIAVIHSDAAGEG